MSAGTAVGGGADAGLLGRCEELRLAGLGKPIDAVLLGPGAVQFSEFDAQQDLLFNRRVAQLHIVDHVLREGSGQRHRAVAHVFARNGSVEAQRFARTLRNDLLIREGVLQNLAQRIQVQLHRHVVKGAFSGLAPYHQGGVAEALAMQQDLARGNRCGVDNVGAAGRNLADIGGIVDDHALADRQTQVFGALAGTAGGGQQDSQHAQRAAERHSGITAAVVQFQVAIHVGAFLNSPLAWAWFRQSW